ncbi:MAG: YafY family transcriptional regulator [Chloroflexi bacterium]|nr:YafY family transcriptional regulator [Chloroflexota bacterium]
MANTATRLITLIMLLQRQPNQTAAQLAQTLDVSVRTVQRYMTMLDEMGIPIYAERGPYGGYALVRGYKMPPLVFTPEEAVAVYLGTSFLEQVWGRLYQEAARGALAKLDNVLPDEQRREVAWARQTLLAIGMHQADPTRSAPHLEKLWEAVHQRRRVRLLYRGRNQPEPLQRDFDPYVLVHGWGWQYCLGYCHLRQGIRSFRVDRSNWSYWSRILRYRTISTLRLMWRRSLTFNAGCRCGCTLPRRRRCRLWITGLTGIPWRSSRMARSLSP